jgi:hypothetical protein
MLVVRRKCLPMVHSFPAPGDDRVDRVRLKWCRIILAILVGACLGGCADANVGTPLIPVRTHVTAGHKYSPEALEFLDDPTTTREEVIATLGPPLLESKKSRVLLYTWETTLRFTALRFYDAYNNPTGSVGTDSLRDWGLFIAYSQDQSVCAHEILRIGTSDLKKACADWRNRLNLPPEEDSSGGRPVTNASPDTPAQADFAPNGGHHTK